MHTTYLIGFQVRPGQRERFLDELLGRVGLERADVDDRDGDVAVETQRVADFRDQREIARQRDDVAMDRARLEPVATDAQRNALLESLAQLGARAARLEGNNRGHGDMVGSLAGRCKFAATSIHKM